MTLRFGEFFLDPQWPFQSHENNSRFANFDFDYQEDVNACKVHEQQNHEVVKVETLFDEQVHSKILKESSDSSMLHSNFSQLMIEETESQALEIFEQQSQCELKQEQLIYSSHLQSRQSKMKMGKGKKRKLCRKKSSIKLEYCSKGKKEKEYERGKYNILSEELKKQIVDQSKIMTMVEVAKKYNVSVNNICRWRKRCDRRSGAGRKVTNMEMESRLLEWLLQQKNPIPRKEVQSMAKNMSGQQDFKASKGWFQRFYKRNKLSYNPNVEILTHNDYRQRIVKMAFDKQRQEMIKSLKKEEQLN